jgi:hypothetical protein
VKKRRLIIIVIASVLIAIAWVVIGTINAKRRAQWWSCAANMKAVGLAGRLYASDRDGHMPTNFISMSNEVITPLVLHCPSDRVNERVRTWDKFSDATCSYEMVTPGALDGATNVVFIRCKIHGHVGYADGSVFHGSQPLPKF